MKPEEMIEKLRRNPRGAAFEFEHEVADVLEAMLADMKDLNLALVDKGELALVCNSKMGTAQAEAMRYKALLENAQRAVVNLSQGRIDAQRDARVAEEHTQFTYNRLLATQDALRVATAALQDLKDGWPLSELNEPIETTIERGISLAGSIE